MEDRRIQKTKQHLETTLLHMLEEKPFEKINVTEICQKAGISRITLYAHYADKYELADELFEQYVIMAKAMFVIREKTDNQEGDSLKSYCNILDVILDILSQNQSFFSIIATDRNPYLSLRLYDTVLKTIEERTILESHRHTLRYSPSQITGFLCYGLAGFLSESIKEKRDGDTIRTECRQLLKDILRSTAIIE